MWHCIVLNGKSWRSHTGPVCVEGSEESETSKRNRITRVRLVNVWYKIIRKFDFEQFWEQQQLFTSTGPEWWKRFVLDTLI